MNESGSLNFSKFQGEMSFEEGKNQSQQIHEKYLRDLKTFERKMETANSSILSPPSVVDGLNYSKVS